MCKMKQKILAILVVFGAMMMVSSVAMAEDLWSVDFEASKAKAEKENKDLMVLFTGSDWCSFCIKLESGVLSKDVFKEKAPEDFVLVKLDYPNDKSKQTQKEIEQNDKLKSQYEISGYPTVYLMDSKGRPYSKLGGYGGNPASEYVDDLVTKSKIGDQLTESLAKAEKAKGIEKAKLLDQAISDIDEKMVFKFFGETIDSIIALDKDGKAGLKEKYASKKRLLDLQNKLAGIQQTTRSKGPDHGITEVSKLLVVEGVSNLEKQQILYVRSYMQFMKQDYAAAKKDMQAAIDADPESENATQYKIILTKQIDPKLKATDID